MSSLHEHAARHERAEGGKDMSEATPQERAQMLRAIARAPRSDDALTLNVAADLIVSQQQRIRELESELADARSFAQVNAMNFADWTEQKLERAERRIAAVEEVLDSERIPDEVYGDDWVLAENISAALHPVDPERSAE